MRTCVCVCVCVCMCVCVCTVCVCTVCVCVCVVVLALEKGLHVWVGSLACLTVNIIATLSLLKFSLASVKFVLGLSGNNIHIQLLPCTPQF